jgi:hypothetical protein
VPDLLFELADPPLVIVHLLSRLQTVREQIPDLADGLSDRDQLS